jgi:GNAT superfamily N-acetyltransferase
MKGIAFARADKSLLPGLEEVWRACFYDDAEYISFFYACNFDRIEIYAALDGNKVAGMLHLIPVEIDGREAYYGYAMGMLPEYRKTGIFPRLHGFVFGLMLERNAAYFLKPANERLSAYYAAQGMREGFFLKRAIFAADKSCLKKSGLIFKDIGPAEYKSMRDACFTRRGCVRWDAASVEYAVTENLRSGGFVNKLAAPEGEYALFGHVEGRNVRIRETTLPGELAEKYGGAIAAYFGAESALADLPPYSSAAGALVPAGMIYNMEKEDEGYFNLPLD